MSEGYPSAIRSDDADDVHGVKVPDPYRWLEDDDDPRTRAWTSQQETLYERSRAQWPDVERWRADLAERTATDVWGTPKVRRGRMFFERRPAGADLPVLVVREADRERPLVDVRALDPTGRTMLDAWEPSVEGDRLAYQVSRNGTEDSQLYVLDVATGLTVDGPIDRVRRSAIGWLPGGAAFYYVARLPPELHPGEGRYHRRVYLHQVGSDQDRDALVFGEGQPRTRFYSVAVSPDGRWLTVNATTGTDPATDVWLADLTTSSPTRPELRQIRGGARTRLHIPAGTGPSDPIWVRTDDGAPRRRVLAGTPADPDTWRELIPQRPDAVLNDFAVLNGPGLARPVAVVGWVCHAAAEVTVHDLADGRQLSRVPLPGMGTVGGFSVPPEPGHHLWFSYTDYATPTMILQFDARTGTTTVWSAVAGAPKLVTTQETYQSSVTSVRMFVVSSTGLPDHPRPAILGGYGGFGVSVAPSYSPRVAAWVEAGGIVAFAAVRGGGDEGEQWHRAGRRELKQNTFDDFHAAADHLVAAGWTTRDRLGIMGGSNGGLLVGAAVTQRPSAYAAAVCLSPLLDMVRYHRSGLGPSWIPEYGSVEDPDQARVLLAYSPYHHVSPGTGYPPVLLAASDGDTRVTPGHARKMCAALQHASTGGQVLFRFDRGVGHGARPLTRAVALQADCLAFLAAQLGLERP